MGCSWLGQETQFFFEHPVLELYVCTNYFAMPWMLLKFGFCWWFSFLFPFPEQQQRCSIHNIKNIQTGIVPFQKKNTKSRLIRFWRIDKYSHNKKGIPTAFANLFKHFDFVQCVRKNCPFSLISFLCSAQQYKGICVLCKIKSTQYPGCCSFIKIFVFNTESQKRLYISRTPCSNVAFSLFLFFFTWHRFRVWQDWCCPVFQGSCSCT